MENEQLLKTLLQEQMQMLQKSIENMEYSYTKVQGIDLSLQLSDSQYELFDSFSSRFMRLYEVLFNQVIRTYFTILREPRRSVLDTMNTAEKLELITSAERLDQIRILRNKVAHEYLEQEWLNIYGELLVSSKDLLKCCTMTRNVIQNDLAH